VTTFKDFQSRIVPTINCDAARQKMHNSAYIREYCASHQAQCRSRVIHVIAMNEIIIVFLVIALAVASVWLFVIEPRGKIHNRIEP
jgi:hypothetical protein